MKPSLTSDSKKTSRQSSIGDQHEHLKISEIQSPESPTKTLEKRQLLFCSLRRKKFIRIFLDISLSSIQFRGQYHYGPEMEEMEILANDPENIDRQSTYEEMREGSAHEPLKTEEFLRDLSASPHNRAVIFVPEYGSQSQMGHHETTEDFIQNAPLDTNMARSSTMNSLHGLTPTKELIIQDTQSLIQTAPQNQKEPEHPPRIASRSTTTPNELYHKTETNLITGHVPIISDGIKQSRLATATSIMTEDPRKKSSPFQTTTDDAIAIVSLSPHPPPPPPGADNNVSGLVAYFFSDFGNEGEGEEDISIDQTNFAVPTGAELITDDDLSGSLMGQSQASLLILHSAHMPRQQQITSTMPLTIENNNERIKVEKESIESKESDATKKRISTATSTLPSSPPPPKQVLPTSIIDDMQTQFARNNNSIGHDHHRQASTTPLNMNTVDSNIDDEEKRSHHSQSRRRSTSSSKASRIHSQIQSRESERNEEQMEENIEEIPRVLSRTHTPLKTIDNEHLRTPERIDSTDQRNKSSSKSLSRPLSMASNHTRNDEEKTPIDSPTKTSLKNIDREYSADRRSVSRQPSAALDEQFPSSRRQSTSRQPSAAIDEQSSPSRQQFTSRQPSCCS